MRKIASIIIALALFLTTVSIAYALYDVSYSGYTGQAARERRLYDPYSREQYFGEGYIAPYNNYGSKGPNVQRNLGAKGTGSAAFNLATNAYQYQGRNPGRISNNDPRMRGYGQLDVAVDLLPYEGGTISFNGLSAISRGTARILSLGGVYGGKVNNAVPDGRVYIQLRDLPPLTSSEVYEMWLGDEDTGYELSMGVVNTVGYGSTAQMDFKISRILEPFEYIIITKEPYPDNDPRPSQNIVLSGVIPTARTLYYPPTSQIDLRTR